MKKQHCRKKKNGIKKASDQLSLGVYTSVLKIEIRGHYVNDRLGASLGSERLHCFEYTLFCMVSKKNYRASFIVNLTLH